MWTDSMRGYQLHLLLKLTVKVSLVKMSFNNALYYVIL